MIRKIPFTVICCLLALYATGCIESKPSVSGIVTDSQEKPLPGVMITARHTENKISKTVFTDEAGRYQLPELDRGNYLRVSFLRCTSQRSKSMQSWGSCC